jgi:hypothetical protein
LGYYPPHIVERTFWANELRRWWEDHFRRKAERGHQWTFVDFADGNFSAPRSLILDTGGWDESFSGRRQDWEFGIRLLEQGVRFAYYPGAVGRHYLDASLETRICGARSEGRDDVRLVAKHPHARAQLELDQNVALIPAPDVRSIGPALKRAARLEALRLRHRWRQLIYQLFATAYVLGISDAVAADELSDFMASPREESSIQLELDLDGRVGLRIPPGAGSVEIVPRIGGRSVAPIEALTDADQWDWEAIAQRVDARVSEPLRERFVLGSLERGPSAAAAPAERIAIAD